MQENSNFLQKSTITREYLARAIKCRTKLNIREASSVIDDVINLVTQHICEDKTLKIRLFGSFNTKYKNARIGRNPKTMEDAEISARKVVKFKVAPTLKRRINDNINSII